MKKFIFFALILVAAISLYNRFTSPQDNNGEDILEKYLQQKITVASNQVKSFMEQANMEGWLEQTPTKKLLATAKTVIIEHKGLLLPEKLKGVDQVRSAYELIEALSDNERQSLLKKFNQDETLAKFMAIAKIIEANESLDTALELWFQIELKKSYNQYLKEQGHSNDYLVIPEQTQKFHLMDTFHEGQQKTIAFELFLMTNVTSISTEQITELGTDIDITKFLRGTLRALEENTIR